jgi:hypothetical protein
MKDNAQIESNTLVAQALNKFNQGLKDGSKFQRKQALETMKKQILIRAFYGWLLYHRHLKTVGTHLVGLVNSSETNNCEKLSIEIQESIKNKIERMSTAQQTTDYKQVPSSDRQSIL